METQNTQLNRKDVNESLTMNEKISIGTTEIAKLVRKALKVKYPNTKFSVRSEYYSMGSSINVNLMECDFRVIKRPQDISEVQKDFLELHDYDVRERMEVQNKRYHQLNPVTLREELKETWCNGVFLTEEGHNLMQDVVKMFDYYNYDDSDAMTDYYSVNFHLSISLGKWDNEMKQKEEEELKPTKTLWFVNMNILASNRTELNEKLGELNKCVDNIRDSGEEYEEQ